MAILVFSDIHLGIKTHSVQGSDGLATAEREARIAMSAIYRRAREEDIDMIICCGDLFHTPHPTTRNIEFVIDWLNNMDAIDKPFYIITGNHDSGVYSNSLVFASRLKLFNTFIISEDIFDRTVTWNGCRIYFIPFVTGSDSRDRTQPVYEMVQKVLSECIEPSIIVAHVYDSGVVVGSEAKLIAKYTETIDFNLSNKSGVMLLLGHAHRHQIYKKTNGMIAIYPGSPFYMNRDDANHDKGFVVLRENGDIDFEKIEGLRKFVSYTIPEGQDVISMIQSMRMPQSNHVFLDVRGDAIDENEIRSILESKSCTLGGVRYLDIEDVGSDVEVDLDSTSNYDILSSFLKETLEKTDQLDNFDKIFSIGKSFIEKHSQKKLEEQ